MLTVIFGAGASYDSDPAHPSTNAPHNNDIRPPLAKSLFDSNYHKYARNYTEAKPALPLFPQLQRAAPHIEQKLEKISNDIARYPQNARNLLAMRYYFRNLISDAVNIWSSNINDVTSYSEFLLRIGQWQTDTNDKIAIITFNYDTLIETAFEIALDVFFRDIDSYISNQSPYQLFKAHGSTNWWRKVQNTQGNLLTHASELHMTDHFYLDGQTMQTDENTGFVPAIAIPTLTKSGFEFPNAHRTALEEVIKETTQLLVIGWRGEEQHFLKLLKNPVSPPSISRIQVVNTNAANATETYKRITTGAPFSCADVRFAKSGFSNFVSGELEDFLKYEK